MRNQRPGFCWPLLVIGALFYLAAGPALPARAGDPKGPSKKKGPPKVDVMFVLDITGSTDLGIKEVKRGIKELMATLKVEKLDVQAGLTVSRDEFLPDKGDGISSDPWTFKFKSGQFFTDNPVEIEKILSRVNDDGGGDLPENSLEALMFAASKTGRSDAVQIQILITDAPPKDARNLPLIRKELAKNKIRKVYLVTSPKDRALYEKLWNKESEIEGNWFDYNQAAARGSEGMLFRSLQKVLLPKKLIGEDK